MENPLEQEDGCKGQASGRILKGEAEWRGVGEGAGGGSSLTLVTSSQAPPVVATLTSSFQEALKLLTADSHTSFFSESISPILHHL